MLLGHGMLGKMQTRYSHPFAEGEQKMLYYMVLGVRDENFITIFVKFDQSCNNTFWG